MNNDLEKETRDTPGKGPQRKGCQGKKYLYYRTPIVMSYQDVSQTEYRQGSNSIWKLEKWLKYRENRHPCCVC